MNHKIAELNMVSWGLAFFGMMAHWLPIIQFLSFTLSAFVSLWQVVQIVKKWLNK
jgi:hypothetical protein